MRYRYPIALALISLFMILSCQTTRTPQIPTGIYDPETIAACNTPFPKSSFSVVHTMEISMPLGLYSTVVGITIADVPGKRLRCTLLSPEGLVLFDATLQDDVTTIHRAVGPLDSEMFAYQLFSDVRLMFMPDIGESVQSAVRREGRITCRWKCNSGGLLECTVDEGGSWTLRLYENDELTKQIDTQGPITSGFARRILLQDLKTAGYSISLELLEAELIEPSEEMFMP